MANNYPNEKGMAFLEAICNSTFTSMRKKANASKGLMTQEDYLRVISNVAGGQAPLCPCCNEPSNVFGVDDMVFMASDKAHKGFVTFVDDKGNDTVSVLLPDCAN